MEPGAAGSLRQAGSPAAAQTTAFVASAVDFTPMSDLDDDDPSLDLDDFIEDAVVAMADPIGVLAAGELPMRCPMRCR